MIARPAALALEDGSVFEGVGFGAEGIATGEICFNTSMSGYQEVMTDPSYHGQIVAMTAPHIGNTGTNPHDDQSNRAWLAGFVVRELSRTASSWRADEALEHYMVRCGVPGIGEVDTRRLTRHVRTAGAMRAALSSGPARAGGLVEVARSAPRMEGRDLASEVSTKEPYAYCAERVEEGTVARDRPRVAAFDFGLKRRILDLLTSRAACDVTVVPAHTTAAEVLAAGYRGVFLSNGPGDPEPLGYAVATVRALLGRVPVFGICLGHQILGLALGGATFKLPFGHRGGNHPVAHLASGRVEITCQNHGFAVEERSLDGTEARVTHVNLNDRTVEGLEVPGVCCGVQYHPEAAPGPHDSRYLFDDFRRLIATFELGGAGESPRGEHGGSGEPGEAANQGEGRRRGTWRP
jgi:carbamoyl-phosphate synthase small subunit